MADPSSELRPNGSTDVSAPEGRARRRGRSWVDWEQAFSYYASLPPGRRCYDAVAKEFKVSTRTVESHGRTEHWKARVREIDREAALRNKELLVSGRADEVLKIQQLIDGSLTAYAERLREGMRMAPSDLERLHRLYRALIDELTEADQGNRAEPDPPDRSPEHVAAVVAALAEAGVLEQLGLTRVNPPDRESNHGGEES